MSLPSFPDSSKIPTREEAINQILTSIAMEELGLSHIINAEGEKIQYAIGSIEGVSGPTTPATIEDLINLNKSVRETLDSATQNQAFLKSKMQAALSCSVMEGPPGEKGDTGDVGTILGTFEKPEDLPMPGNQGDAYLVGGKLYVWNVDTGAWKEVGDLSGPAGPKGDTGPAGQSVGTISGVVETEDDLPKQGEPGAEKGSLYLVLNEPDGPATLYVWNELIPGWEEIGPLEGVVGPQGPAGPATIKVDSVVELEPGKVPTVENVGSDNQHVELKFGIPRGAAGTNGKSAYEIALEKGFDGTEEQWLASLKASAVTVIPFASQQAPFVGTNASGEPINVALLGFGWLGFSTGMGGENAEVAIPIDPSDKSFNLGASGNTNRQIAFSMPFDMKLRSVYLTTGNWEAFSALIPRGTVVFPYVQIYTAPAGTNLFLPLEGAIAKPTEGLHPESARASTMLAAEVKGLEIELKAGTRVAICGMMEIHGDSARRSYYLYFTGGIGLST